MRAAVPGAIQVADRWRLWHNLIEAVEKTVIAERAALRPPEPNELESAANQVAAVLDSRPGEPPVRPVEGPLATRTRQRWAAVQDLLAAGRSILAIARELRLQCKTVRRFARAATVEELLDRPRPRRDSLLDPYKPHLQERFTAGGVDAVQLTREITELGYRGSLKTGSCPCGGVKRFGRRFPRRPAKSEEGAYVRVEESIACRAVARGD